MHTKAAPALILNIPGPPKTKENKQGFGGGRYYNQKHKDVVQWEIDVNHLAIAEMRRLGFIGPYKGRCRIVAAQTYESWKRCDITNYWKSLNDALNGAVWMDDSQVDAAESVRYVNRDNPGVHIMVWFYDIDFNEKFGTGKFAKTGNQIMKYPAKYAIFDLQGYEYRTRMECIEKPGDAAATRFGTFERLLTLDERKKEKAKAKGSTTKPRKSTKKGATSDGKAKADSTKAGRRGTGTAGRQRTTRKRRSS